MIHVRAASLERYDSSNVPRDYRCIVTVGESDVLRQISLNRPLRLGPYKISQGDWMPDAERPVTIAFAVNTRPGLPVIWTGMAMIAAGLLFGFYVRPLLQARGAKA
jgi:hypothetical protein